MTGFDLLSLGWWAIERAIQTVKAFAERIVDLAEPPGYRTWRADRFAIMGQERRERIEIPGREPAEFYRLLFGLQAGFTLGCHALAVRALLRRRAVLEAVGKQTVGALEVSPAHRFFSSAWIFNRNATENVIAAWDRIEIIENQSWAATLSELYQRLLPPVLRRGLGEFHTPYPLATLVIRELTRNVDCSAGTVCDPACGSGIFLEAILRHRLEHGLRDPATLTATCLGLEINPAALVATWTTLALALAPILSASQETQRLALYKVDSTLLSDPPPPKLAARLPVDLVVGNPAWINWEDLTGRQRDRLREQIAHYGLDAVRTKVGATKLDISGLSLLSAADRLLRRGGALAFVITQAALRAKANAGLRRFALPDGTRLAPFGVHDFAGIQMFRGAHNRTAVLMVKKHEAPRYPVTTTVWRAKKPTSGNPLTNATKRTGLSIPMGQDPTAPWITLPSTLVDLLERFLDGKHDCRPRLGVNTGGGSAVFWGALRAGGETAIEFRNCSQAGRIAAPQLPWLPVEPDLVFPLAKGGDLQRWRCQARERVILVPHTATTGIKALSEESLQQNYPRLWALLSRPEIRSRLARRRALGRWGGQAGLPWYTLFEIGPYTFYPYKVAYRGQVATDFVACVLGSRPTPLLGHKIVIPDQTVSFVPVHEADHAHFLCGLLNSCFVRLLYRCFNYKHPGAFFVRALRLPRFVHQTPLHVAIAKNAALLAARTPDAGRQRERTNDQLVARLFGLETHHVDRVRAELPSAD